MAGSSVSELAAAVRGQRHHLDRQAGRAQQVAEAGKAAEAEVAALTAQLELYDKVGSLLTSIGEQAQETARGQVEGLVTRALQAVFGPHLSFLVVPDEVGGQAVLRLLIRTERDGAVTERPVLDSHGGGLAAVVGYVLRLVVLLLTPDVRRMLVLDEPFTWLSEDLVPAMAEFLQQVATETGVQHLIVTHQPELGRYADSRVRLSLGPDLVTRVTEAEVE